MKTTLSLVDTISTLLLKVVRSHSLIDTMRVWELLSAVVELRFRVLVHEEGYSHASVSYINGVPENL